MRWVRLALIAELVDKAQAFFKNCRRKLKFKQEHYLWLLSLCKAIESADGADLEESAVEAFQGFFDQVSNPEVRSVGAAKQGNAVCTNISLLRLELALITQRYVLKKPLAGNWVSVLRHIRE